MCIRDSSNIVNAASLAIGKSAEASCPAFSIPSSRLIFWHCSCLLYTSFCQFFHNLCKISVQSTTLHIAVYGVQPLLINLKGREQRELADDHPLKQIYEKRLNTINRYVKRGALDAALAEVMKKLAKDKMPVSYTHLDVYKRQL